MVYVLGIKNSVQLNLDYADSLGLSEIVQIIKAPDNRKYED